MILGQSGLHSDSWSQQADKNLEMSAVYAGHLLVICPPRTCCTFHSDNEPYDAESLSPCHHCAKQF